MTAVSDNFDRADGGLGGNWTLQFSSFPYFTDAQIVSNKVQSTVVGGMSGSEIYTPVNFNQDQVSQVDIVTFTGAGELSAGVFLRAAITQETFYLLRAYINTGSLTSDIQKAIAGAYTTLASESATTWAGGNVIRGVAQGSNLYLLRNGAMLLSATDGTIFSGKPGLHVFVETTVLTDAEIDNWYGADFTLTDYTDFPKPKIRDAALRGQI